MKTIEPMLAKPEGIKADNCFWERKYRGARLIAFVSGKDIRLQARTGSDKTDTFPDLVIATRKPCILDGEIVSLTDNFNQIQRRINRQYEIDWASKNIPIVYPVFDILEVDGKCVENEPLWTRKEMLEEILIPTETSLIAPYTKLGYEMLDRAQKENWEGIMGKPIDDFYWQGKRGWLKVKLFTTEEFYAVGYTLGTGRRQSTFGALVLVNLDWVHVGQVGTGFDDAELEDLMRSMKPSSISSVDIPCVPVKPFKVLVRYQEYSNDGMLVSPSYLGRV